MGLLVYCLLLLFLLAVGTPIGFSLLLSAVVYIISFSSLDLIVLPQKMQGGLDSFPLLAVPFFLMLGDVMSRGGITYRLVNLANALVGHIRGGLAHVNILTSMLLAGIQGIATADTAAVGSVLIPAMKEDGYPSNFSAAITAASSAVGPIIPPSLSMVIYGSMGNVSIGRLFLAGAIPGFILGLYLMVYSYFFAGAKRQSTKSELGGFSMKTFSKSLRAGALPIIIPIVVVGGIVGGVFTPTESGAVATMVAILLGGVVYRQLGWRELYDSTISTLNTLGQVMIVVAGAATFGWILSIEGAAAALQDMLFSISKSPFVIMLVINVILIVLGCFVETIALLVLLTPILLPIVVQAGYDPVHFGVIMVLNLTIGLTTPPLGVCIFVASSIAHISIEDFIRAMFPLYIPLLLGLLTTILFPKMVMFLPNALMPMH
jgi:C4-dicarboxylate transporter DctM subunit